MDKTVTYQGYTIQPAPYQTDGETWRLRIFISLEDHCGNRTRELSAESVYATKQEAEIHGIAFGQRIIDGKVEGLSVVDMKTEDRRVTPRLRVQFRTTFSASPKAEGVGVILDLSLGGCRIVSPVVVELGVSLELRIHVPDLEWPLMIEAASVQWVSGETFGLAFFRMKDMERQRLEQVIIKLQKSHID
jgi:PilZ domain